ncbi:putative bifunctional diguanylate cyclase/phosphodiesterase [Polymorphobacter fuscus]|nr:EAL domain-containing protein [Polymorphobacter fuscus]NJC07853.1 diguanylate cyclase (GGDEF)-like protein [Polymorphobacter fuscus]
MSFTWRGNTCDPASADEVPKLQCHRLSNDQEAERLRALRAYHILDTPPEAAFDRLTLAAAAICGTPVALVSLVDEHRQWFKANVGLAKLVETERDIAFCDVAIQQSEPLEVLDARTDPRFASNPLVTCEPGVCFYVGVPLTSHDGFRIGTLCVMDHTPREGGLTSVQRQLLSTLAEQVVTELELRSALGRAKEQQRALVERNDKLCALQARVANAFESSGVIIWEWEHAEERLWLGAPDVIASITKHLVEDALRTVHPDDRDAMVSHLKDYICGRVTHYECEIRVAASDGGWRWMLMRGASVEHDRMGIARAVSGTLTDIDERKRAKDRLNWIVSHDTLTGLANRLRFQELLEAHLAFPAVKGQSPARLALILLDIDHFKGVNDVYGHAVGDALLQEVAQRLKCFIADGETAARLGGDEFTLLIPDCGIDEAIVRRIDGLVAILREPLMVDGFRLDCRASIGVSVYPDHGTDAATLLKNADIAMYRAKGHGRGIATLYLPDFSAELIRRRRLFDGVRSAMAAGSLAAYYQAQFSLDHGSIIGFEALLRIQDSAGNYSLPADLSDAFQDAELGVEIGNWMIRQVVADLAVWEREGVDVGYVAINVAAPELRRSDYGERLLSTLAAAGVPCKRLQIEITEGVFLGQDSDTVADTLKTLSNAGIQIAFDDFGTGFAALSHLKRFPINTIKIDRSFICDLTTNPDDAAIVDAVIGLAKGLGMEVIAEGVETVEQAMHLYARRCDYAQGFYLHRPMPAAAVQALLLAEANSGQLNRIRRVAKWR